MQPPNTMFEQHAVVSSSEPPAPPDKSPVSQQRPLLASCPAASIPEPRRDPALCPCPLGWQSCNTSKQPKLLPPHSTQRHGARCRSDWSPLWAQDSVCRAALVNTLKAEKTSRGPWTTSVMDRSTKHLSFPSPGPVSLVLSKRQGCLYLLCFKGYPKHHYWLPVFWQGGPHKTNGPRKYVGVQHRGGQCVWLLCHKSIGNS